MRVKGGPTTRRRRKKWLKAAEGSWGTRHTSYRIAKQTVIRASEYAYNDRKKRKNDFRKLWIARINAAVREMGYTYSDFMHQLKVNNIEINRKLLSELAINNPSEFELLVKKVMK
ncbi:MAG: 50S ribosomal protein L20 [Mycoplasma sp.]